jgi:CDGSH-type Zn-finger protein
MSAPREEEPRRVFVTREGPVLVEGPVEIVLEDGRSVVSERNVVAVCGCKRSRRYPFCDTSHRKRARESRTTVEASPKEPT